MSNTQPKYMDAGLYFEFKCFPWRQENTCDVVPSIAYYHQIHKSDAITNRTTTWRCCGLKTLNRLPIPPEISGQRPFWPKNWIKSAISINVAFVAPGGAIHLVRELCTARPSAELPLVSYSLFFLNFFCRGFCFRQLGMLTNRHEKRPMSCNRALRCLIPSLSIFCSFSG